MQRKKFGLCPEQVRTNPDSSSQQKSHSLVQVVHCRKQVGFDRRDSKQLIHSTYSATFMSPSDTVSFLHRSVRPVDKVSRCAWIELSWRLVCRTVQKECGELDFGFL